MEASLSEIWDRLKAGKNYRRLLGRSVVLQVLYEVREKLGRDIEIFPCDFALSNELPSLVENLSM